MYKVICLYYHRINEIQDAIYDLTVSPKNFESQMRYLKSKYSIIRFEDSWESGNGLKFVITFDDGYADNYKYALPILEKYQIPATIFVSTELVGTHHELWWDELGRLFTCGYVYPKSFTLDDELYHYTWNTGTLEERIEVAKTIRWLLRMEPDLAYRDEWFRQIREWAHLSGEGREENRVMSVKELQEVSSSEYITIGAHTVHHVSLGCMSKEQQKVEVHESIEYLKMITGKEIVVFSYPFGGKMDYTNDTIDILKKANIKKAATTEARIWNLDDDMYRIPRIAVRDWDLDTFCKKLNLGE